MQVATETVEQLIEQLQQARREAAYYQRLARESGERRLKESEAMSSLIEQLRQTKEELARSRDELEHRVQERTTELQQTNARLEALRAAMNDISANLDTETLLYAILGHAVDLANVTGGEIVLYKQQYQNFCITTSLKQGQNQADICRMLTEEALNQVVQAGQPLIINDYSLWLKDTAIPSLPQSLMLVPLLVHHDLVGIIGIYDERSNHHFAATDEKLLHLFAQQATIAIQNAHLFAEVQQLATVDSLTGLYNRRCFFKLAEKETQRALRSGNPLSVMMLDIDHFKSVNDTYGHLAGDEVLRVLAELCKSTVRTHDLVARYGGEEIILLLPETNATTAQQIAERLRSLIGQTGIPFDQEALLVTVSLGVVIWDGSGDLDLERLIDRADHALYQAKALGRNCVSTVAYAR